MTTHRPWRRTLLPLLAVIALLVGACSTAGSDGDAGATSDGPAPAAAQDEASRDTNGESAREGDLDSAFAVDSVEGGPLETQPGAAPRPGSDIERAAVISVGTVSLSSKDVADARFDVQKVTDRFRGQITDEDTRTDDDGKIDTSRMVLRIPSEDFQHAMDELEQVASLENSTITSEDVTTQVINNRVRIRAQKASIARIQALLARAQNIGDIIRIEGQLSRRQANLTSLERQQAYLSDQTSMSTITVHLERTPEKAPPKKESEDQAGFVAGLDAGWDTLKTLGTGLATASGALLPFLVVGLVLALPFWLLVLPALRRRRPADAAPVEG